MSTRANIIISQTFGNKKDNKTVYIILYSHYDGYPSGVGSDLKNKLLKFARCKNNFGLNDVKDYIQNNSVNFEYEITNSIHGDIEYLYLINIDNKNKEFKLICYNGGFYDDTENEIAKNGCNSRFEVFSNIIKYDKEVNIKENKESNFMDRLLGEYNELKEKTKSLQDFLYNKSNKEKAGQTQWELLNEQFICMTKYLNILQERLTDLNIIVKINKEK